MTKSIIKNTLKISLTAGLLYWLIQSGKLDFSLLMQVIQRADILLFTLLLLIIVFFIASWRYKKILEFKTKSQISTLKVARVTWIGLFFNSVLPGSVTGDIVKIIYIKDIDSKLSKRFLLGSVLVDRFIGLFGLIFTLGLFSLAFYSELASYSQDLKALLNINMTLLFAVTMGFLSLFLFKDFPKKLENVFNRVKILGKIYQKLLLVWEELCSMRKQVVYLTAASVVLQSLAILAFWYCTKSYADSFFSLKYAFSLTPIGFLTIAIPIAPSGMGVGHAVFDKLFTFVGITNGASLFNIYAILLLCFNLTGFIPYLLNRKVSQEEIESFQDDSLTN